MSAVESVYVGLYVCDIDLNISFGNHRVPAFPRF